MQSLSALVPRQRPSLIVIVIAIVIAFGLSNSSESQVIVSRNDSGNDSGNFSGRLVNPVDGHSAADVIDQPVAKLTLTSANIVGGDSIELTLGLTGPAPDGDIEVALKTSDESVIKLPATVMIPAGQNNATISASTLPVDADTIVAISAIYAGTITGTALTVTPATKPAFTIAANPSTVTIAPGHSGSTKITTTVTDGYDQALQLSALKIPTGVTVTLTPSTIPAPGAGTSKVKITVAKSVAAGTYTMHIRATDGTTSKNAALTLIVPPSGAGATFKGCWYQQDGHRYQGVEFSLANPGTYPFNAILYYGTTCDPNNWADQFGFGTPLTFGGFSYIFWFTDFADRTDMSAFWYVGSDQSECMNYSTAPDC
jgi:hypothetical protein